jgi:saccharopine dehydrogenase-like NADP-dependent oxidoreductase
MNSVAPALILGGYGSVGSRSARMLRRLQPGLAIAIAGRNLSKAEAIASEIGNATAVSIDIDKADLGLDADEPYSVVVTALRDLSLNTMRFA